jgi:transposase InsO family protein
MDFSRRGKPTDNAFIETFNGTLRDKCLNLHWFDTIAQASQLIEAWRRDYNASRPRRASRGAERRGSANSRLSLCFNSRQNDETPPRLIMRTRAVRCPVKPCHPE